MRHGESGLLALLDGEPQIDNVVFVATTNYPENLDKRMKNRPSRFDYVRRIGMPSNAARQKFIEHKNPRLATNPEELEQWVRETKGFSVAHLKELIVSVEIFGSNFDESLKRLKDMMEVDITSEHNENKKFGFIENS